MRTEQLVSQIVLAASWDFSDDRLDPVEAAAEMIGVPAGDPRIAVARRIVRRAPGLSWEEQVGVAAHTLLETTHDVPMAA